MLKHGILGLLNYGDMTGYEIKTAFEDSLNHFWHAQTSQIYRELQLLEKNGSTLMLPPFLLIPLRKDSRWDRLD